MSESTIYRYIYDDRERGGELYKNLPHSGKPYKKKVSRGDQTKIPNRVGIEQRPAIADEKTEFGHFEIDTVVGRDHQSYLLTLVDKANKMCCIRKMPNKQAKTVINTFMNVVGSTFFDLKPSLLTTEQSLPVMRPFQRSLKQTFTLLDLIVLVIEV
ncbi:hypothetical protein KU39_4p7 (plasmid) [Piscirickettsia salmonis]|uniref:Transposase, IS30 family n=1 Tax=Piscirickettsia salmonis TaxID=1238 RepID=A0AAC8VLM2_PISSA|nr:IS30 family transposase [Piscirickettsia salmonis]ALB24703.1 hypothetical protein KU39_4p7 [Piscirickettsia salmonis]APS75341.1 hypothetical protein AVM70_17395 [Piscirickettsia salmonis]